MAAAYLTARGAKQGDINGGVTEKGREGSIALHSVSYAIDVPYDQATGHASGKRQHKPITITKVIDQATPKLLEALVTNETLTNVKIAFWRPSSESASPYFLIALTNATLSGVALAPSGEEKVEETEQFQLTFEKITWTWIPGGEEAQDTWSVTT